MIYIASPYSHRDPEVMARRAHEVAAFAAHCFRGGTIVYCPIAAWHWVALEHDLPKDWPSWRRMDFAVIRHCSEMLVLCLDGWRDSVGVTDEVDLAEQLEIPVSLICPETYETLAGERV